MKLQLKRLISQLFFLFSANLGAFGLKTGFCYPLFYCHSCPAATSACPIRAIEIGVFKGNYNWRFLIYPLIIIGFVGVLMGRAVCGWACPIGLLQRATSKVPRALKAKFPKLKKYGKHPIEHYLRYTKYVLFIGLVVLIPIWVGVMFTDFCPVGFLVGTIPLSILNPGAYAPNEFFIAAAVIFSLFLVLIFTIEQGWCRYFCPVGAMLAPFNKVSILHMSVNKAECIDCNVCSDVCPMGINVPEMHRDPECILCGKCVSKCPKKLITFERT